MKSLSPELCYQLIKLEERAGTDISSLIEESLRAHPKSGELWSLAIEHEPLSKRKAKSIDALEKCENNVNVVNSIAMIYWLSRFHEKTRSWFERSLKLDPKVGDTWA